MFLEGESPTQARGALEEDLNPDPGSKRVFLLLRHVAFWAQRQALLSAWGLGVGGKAGSGEGRGHLENVCPCVGSASPWYCPRGSLEPTCHHMQVWLLLLSREAACLGGFIPEGRCQGSTCLGTWWSSAALSTLSSQGLEAQDVSCVMDGLTVLLLMKGKSEEMVGIQNPGRSLPW